MMTRFAPVSAAAFEQFIEVKPQVFKRNEKVNFCDDCGTPMQRGATEYTCNDCGRIDHQVVELGPSPAVQMANIRISTGVKKGKFYNITGDYSVTQLKAIERQLNQNNAAYKGNKFSKDVLSKAALGYNAIQQLIIVDDGESRKFVRRGAVKDEVLAALVYYESVRAGSSRKKKDIATMMKLVANGFSKGDDILRTLAAEGKVDLPIDKEPVEDYVDRYLELLGRENAVQRTFIIDLVNKSEELSLGMQSQISSKIVGAIWILNVQANLGISIDELEKAADNTKKNTFMKFYKVVFDNMRFFAPIFDAAKVPRIYHQRVRQAY